MSLESYTGEQDNGSGPRTRDFLTWSLEPVRSAYPGLLPASDVALYWYPCPDTILQVVRDVPGKGELTQEFVFVLLCYFALS